jgi:hypothetical protein
MMAVIGDFIKYLMPSNPLCQEMVWNLRWRGLEIRGAGIFALHDPGFLHRDFLPLEVALNRSWGVAKSRNYLMNQLIALGLALWMVILGMPASCSMRRSGPL